MGKKRKKPPFVRRTGKAPISKKQLEAKAAETGLTKLPTISLVATINTMAFCRTGASRSGTGTTGARWSTSSRL